MQDTDIIQTGESSIVASIRNSISVLEGGLATQDDVLTALNFMARLKQLTRELSEQVEAGAIAYIKEHGDITDGEVRYYAAPNKTTKCVKPQETIHALLTATGGDETAMVECLAANAFKPGACRKLLPDDVYADLFETKETDKLEEGKPKKSLQKFDPRFVR